MTTWPTLLIALLMPLCVAAQVASEPAAPSSAPAADETEAEALYQSWTKEKDDPNIARQYFLRFPDGPRREAIVDEISRVNGFARVSGAPLLVRFRGFHVDNSIEVHDGKSYSGVPGFNMKPTTTKLSAKPGSAFVVVVLELFAYAPVDLTNEDLTLAALKRNAPQRVPIRLFPVGAPNQKYGAFRLSPEKLPHLILEAAWEAGIKEAEGPKVALFKSQFDLVALKVPKL